MHIAEQTPAQARAESFLTTQWSLVLSAGRGSSESSAHALEELCGSYWFPLYAFVRRQGHSPEDAQDLIQEFFARFLSRGSFALADPERGRFRSFLLTSLKRFLTEEWRRANRQKRGGSQVHVPFSTEDSEGRYETEPPDDLSPDRLYDRRWAEALIERVLGRLRTDYESTGRSAVYLELQQFLWGRQAEVSYATIAAQLGMNEGGVKVAVHRLRQRFRDLLRQEVANTVEQTSEVDDELRHLLSVFGG